MCCSRTKLARLRGDRCWSVGRAGVALVTQVQVQAQEGRQAGPLFGVRAGCLDGGGASRQAGGPVLTHKHGASLVGRAGCGISPHPLVHLHACGLASFRLTCTGALQVKNSGPAVKTTMRALT